MNLYRVPQYQCLLPKWIKWDVTSICIVAITEGATFMAAFVVVFALRFSICRPQHNFSLFTEHIITINFHSFHLYAYPITALRRKWHLMRPSAYQRCWKKFFLKSTCAPCSHLLSVSVNGGAMSLLTRLGFNSVFSSGQSPRTQDLNAIP